MTTNTLVRLILAIYCCALTSVANAGETVNEDVSISSSVTYTTAQGSPIDVRYGVGSQFIGCSSTSYDDGYDYLYCSARSAAGVYASCVWTNPPERAHIAASAQNRISHVRFSYKTSTNTCTSIWVNNHSKYY